MIFGIVIPTSLCIFWKCFLYLFLCFLVSWQSNVQHKDARLHLTKIPVFLYLNGLAVLSQDPACSLQATHGQTRDRHLLQWETASSLLASFPAFPAFQAVLSQESSAKTQHTHCIDNIAPWPHVHMTRLETDNSYHVATASLLTSIPGFPAFQHQRRGSP